MLRPFRNLTTRRQTEQVLIRSQQSLTSLLEVLPMGAHLYRLEPDDRLVFTGFNRAADTILGIDHAPLVGRTIEEAFPGLAGTPVPDRYRAVCRNGGVWRSEEVDYEDDRVRGAFEVHVFQTAPASAAVLFLDITERKRADEALRRSEERYRALTEQTGQLFYEHEIATGRIQWQGAIEAVTGMTPEEFGGVGIDGWADRIHPEDRARVVSLLAQLERDKPAFNIDYRFRRKNGTYVLIEDHAAFLPSADRALARMVGTMRDVTRVRAAEEELRASEARRQKLESLALLAGGIAHDFNNLLTGILGNISLAKDGHPSTSDTREWLDEAERAGRRAGEQAHRPRPPGP